MALGTASRGRQEVASARLDRIVATLHLPAPNYPARLVYRKSTVLCRGGLLSKIVNRPVVLANQLRISGKPSSDLRADSRGESFLGLNICLQLRRQVFGNAKVRKQAAQLSGLKPLFRKYVRSLTNTAAIQRMRADSGADIEMRQSKYLNNLIEQDHRAVKRLTRPVLRFKNFRCARALLDAIKDRASSSADQFY